MIRCHKCNSRMVKVDLIDVRGRAYAAIVCTNCGRTYSKSGPFKKAWKFKAG